MSSYTSTSTPGTEDAAGAFVRVTEGGAITDRVEIDRPGFSCVLGGPDGATLFMLGMAWREFDSMVDTAAERTGVVHTARVSVPSS